MSEKFGALAQVAAWRCAKSAIKRCHRMRLLAAEPMKRQPLFDRL